MVDIKANIESVREQVRDIAKRCGRNPDDILLCAVTKTRTVDEINNAIDAGITDIGENKVQEIVDKIDGVRADVRWHLIGHLQRNKVKYIVDKVYMIHSVDSAKLAEEIDKRAAQHDIKMNILIQVNSAGEESKFGIAVDEVKPLIDYIAENCRNLVVKGLMCIAPITDDLSEAAEYFGIVKKIYDSYISDERLGVDFEYLSMGMSGDYEAAISEGSNMIRIGTAIFGEREYV